MSRNWLVFAPLGIAILVFVLQKLRAISTLFTAMGLGAMVYLAIQYRQGLSLLVLGRSFDLSPLEAASLAFCLVLALVVVLYSYDIPEADLAHSLILLAMVVFSISAMARNLAIGGLLFQTAAILAAMLIPSSRPRSSMVGMRALILLVISGCCSLLASWALEGQAADSSNTLFANLGSITLAIGFGIVLPIMPFHIWQPPIYKHSTPLAVVACTVILNIVAMLRINNLLFVTPWAGGKEYFVSLLLAGGLVTSAVAGLLAIPQRSVHRALAFAAVSDAGLALASLAVGTELGIKAAFLHMFCRGLGATAMVMAVGIFRQVLGGDDTDHLRGALRQTPMAVAGLVIAGLSLSGLPPMAGFATRLMIYHVLGEKNTVWAVVALAATMGPAVAFIRCMVSALTPMQAAESQADGADEELEMAETAPLPGNTRLTTPTRRAEPVLAGILILTLSLPLLVLGVRPELVMLPLFP